MKKIVLLAGVGVFLFVSLLFIEWEKPTPHFRADAPLADAYRGCINGTKPEQEKGRCLKDLAEYAGGNTRMSEIDAAIGSLTKSEDLAWCHEFMHYAGWGLYKKTKNMSDAFAAASSRCDSGMFHGVVEEYISEASAGKEAR